MERYNPLARMHGAGGPSYPRGGDADRNVSASRSEGARLDVAAQRHRPSAFVGHDDWCISICRAQVDAIATKARAGCGRDTVRSLRRNLVARSPVPAAPCARPRSWANRPAG